MLREDVELELSLVAEDVETELVLELELLLASVLAVEGMLTLAAGVLGVGAGAEVAGFVDMVSADARTTCILNGMRLQMAAEFSALART